MTNLLSDETYILIAIKMSDLGGNVLFYIINIIV